MLMKLITCGADFDRTLRRRRFLAVALLLVGLVGITCYFLLVHDSPLPDFAQGFYLGASSGITLGALILLVRTQYLITHPEARKKARIREIDEREQTITRTAFFFAGAVTFFGSAAALFILLPINMGAFYALLGAMAVYALSWAAASLWLSKHL